MSPRMTLSALVLAAGLSACGGSQPESKPPAAASAAPHASADVGLAAYLPAPGAPAGWTRTRQPEAYNSDNLWEFIDGAAETYVGFGVQDALSAGYTFGGAEVGIEIYQASDSLHAFGLYAQERPPAPRAATVGAEGYAGSNVLVFWKGPCYVKLTAPSADKPGPDALLSLSRAIAGRIPGGAPLPREIQAFPAANLVPRSVKFLPKDVLGQRQFTNGFEATYRDAAATSRLVIIPFETPADAASAFARYRAFVAENGKLRPGTPKTGDETFAGDDRFNGRVLAARSGRLLVISVGASSDGVAAGLANECFRASQEGGL